MYLAAGKLDEAINHFEHAHRLAPWHAMTAGLLAAALMRAGNGTRAAALMEALGSSPRPVWRGVVYHLHVGELDEAANWYQVMIDEREPFALVCANAPVTLPLHAHPRWQALATQMRLPTGGDSPAHFAGRLNTRGQLPGPLRPGADELAVFQVAGVAGVDRA